MNSIDRNIAMDKDGVDGFGVICEAIFSSGNKIYTSLKNSVNHISDMLNSELQEVASGELRSYIDNFNNFSSRNPWIKSYVNEMKSKANTMNDIDVNNAKDISSIAGMIQSIDGKTVSMVETLKSFKGGNYIIDGKFKKELTTFYNIFMKSKNGKTLTEKEEEDGIKIAETLLDKCKIEFEKYNNAYGEETDGMLSKLKFTDDIVQNYGKNIGTLERIYREYMGTNVAEAEYSADPVNMSTGNFVYNHIDLKIEADVPLEFRRYYNSLDREKNSMGRCFVHNYEMKLELIEDYVEIRLQDGQRINFAVMEDGTYRRIDNSDTTLCKNEDGYLLENKYGEKIIFDNKGLLIRKENLIGRGISFEYYDAKENEEVALLKKAISDSKVYIEYCYEDGLLRSVKDNTGRCVSISYSDGKIHTVTVPSGGVYSYKYGPTGRITEIVNSRNALMVKNEFDEKNRTSHQEFADGTSMNFEYDDENNTVSLTERNGSVIKYVHDSMWRNIETKYSDGTSEKSEYNHLNQRVGYTDRNGNTSRMSYDNKGNLTQRVNAKGEKINYTYDANNNLLTYSVNGRILIKNGYDSKGRLISCIRAKNSVSNIEYGELGKPVVITNVDNTKKVFEYDDKGNVSKYYDELGALIEYKYDDLNRVIETIDPKGNRITFEYDNSDRIIKSVNKAGDVRTIEYNTAGKITSYKDYDGYTVSATYNALGAIDSISDKEGNITKYFYDNMWNLSEIVYPNGGKVINSFNQDNRIESVTYADGGRITYSYDYAGNVTAITNQENNSKYYEYDEINRLVKFVDEMGYETKYSYDEFGNVIKKTNSLGGTVEYSYDDMGRLATEKNEILAITSYEYDDMGRVVRKVYPNGAYVRNEYLNGLLSKVEYSDGRTKEYEYDCNGNCIRVVDNAGNENCMEYDSLDRIIKQSNTDGNSIMYEYDCMGNMILLEDSLGRKTKYEYTPNGKIACVMDAMGNSTMYKYDCMGNLIELVKTSQETDIKTEVTTYSWNMAGKLAEMTNPKGHVEKYSYDMCGRLVSKIDREGFETKYAYDKRGLLNNIQYADGNTVLMSYDSLRKLKEIKDVTGVTTFERDMLGRVVSTTDVNGKTVGYEWGSMDEKLALIYPDGKRADYTYNQNGKIVSLETANGIIRYAYDELGRLNTKSLPNNIVTTYQYNRVGDISSISHIGDNIEEIYSYEYDVVGNKIGLTKSRKNKDGIDLTVFGYEYDQLNRLTTVSENNEISRSYKYDGYGNRILLSEYTASGTKTTKYRYDENNQLLVSCIDGLEEAYEYDKRGNLVSVINNGELVKNFAYNYANKMISVDDMEKGIKADFMYDGLGNRVGEEITAINGVASTMNNQQIKYINDLTKSYYNLLAVEEDVMLNDLEKTNEVSKNFYWDNEVAAIDELGKQSYYVQDSIGSILGVVNSEGALTERYDYDEFGKSKVLDASNQTFGFTGYVVDDISNMYYAQQRNYDPLIGRFTCEDLLPGYAELPVSLNRYVYCWNRPLDWVDLDGKKPKKSSKNEVPKELPISRTDPESMVIPEDASNIDFRNTMFDYNNPALVDSEIGNMKGTGVENCHAAGMGLMRHEAIGEGRGVQPGEFVSGHASASTKLDANAKYDPTNNYENLVNATIGDYAGAAHKTLKPYEEGMTGGYLVVLVVSEGENGSPQDYHYYKQAPDGTFEHKPGSSRYVIGVKDPVADAKERGYGKTVVYLYATDNKE